MGQMHAAFRHAEELTGLIGIDADTETPGIGHADILRGKADNASCNV